MTDRAVGVQETLPPHPSVVAKARQLVCQEARRAGLDDLAETAELLVSEVVTNALVHAGTPLELRVLVGSSGLRVEVTDGSAVLPALRHHSTMAGTGRGLRLVQALAGAWGADPVPGGKVVWFELAPGDGAGGGPLIDLEDAGTGVRTLDADGAVHIELLNVPLLLHVAWHQHAESLLREYLLVSLGGDDPDQPDDEERALEQLMAHASASEAIALLFAHLPDPGLGADPDELMASAGGPQVTSAREVLPVPPGLTTCFAILDRTLDAAMSLADSGALLTPPTLPEIRAFRRWVCGEVEEQSRGVAATPWHDQDGPVERWQAEVRWESDVVADAVTSRVAADDENYILAVSPAAIALLGYDDASELVGHRLVEIIPERYRQAHQAGFTLYLASGRAPLLERPVVVPARRRDGSEVEIEITIFPERLAGGRQVFVADLAPVPVGRR